VLIEPRRDPGERAAAAAPDHDHLRLFGEVDFSGHGGREENLAIYLGGATVLAVLLDDLDGIVDEQARVLFLP
jgi:hypothetical protein